jgi:hypothetical protein
MHFPMAINYLVRRQEHASPYPRHCEAVSVPDHDVEHDARLLCEGRAWKYSWCMMLCGADAYCRCHEKHREGGFRSISSIPGRGLRVGSQCKLEGADES